MENTFGWENDPSSPRLEQFGLDFSVYEKYHSILRRKRIAVGVGWIALLTAVYAGCIHILKHGPGEAISISIVALFFLGTVDVLAPKCLPTLIAPLLASKLRALENVMAPFEQAYTQHYSARLENFHSTYLFRKRSSNESFKNNLEEFQFSIYNLALTNKLLATRKIALDYYAKYANSRKWSLGSSPPSLPLIPNHRVVSDQEQPKTRSSSAIVREEQIPVPYNPPEQTFRLARKIDWKEISILKGKTGLRGEEIAAELERNFLRSVQRHDLAQQVKHVSAVDGDGLGYDILSFFGDGKQKFIEVKSTTKNIETPFYISRNELAFLWENRENSFVYRVSIGDEGAEPRLQIFSSREIIDAELTPVNYLVKVL